MDLDNERLCVLCLQYLEILRCFEGDCVLVPFVSFEVKICTCVYVHLRLSGVSTGGVGSYSRRQDFRHVRDSIM